MTRSTHLTFDAEDEADRRGGNSSASMFVPVPNAVDALPECQFPGGQNKQILYLCNL